jgi:hypothetical protein
MEMWGHYKNGFLPVAGGILDQSISFMAAMTILDGAINHIHKVEAENRSRQTAKHSR